MIHVFITPHMHVSMLPPSPLFFPHTNKLVVASTKGLVNELLFQTSELIAVCWQNHALTSHRLRLLPGVFCLIPEP